MRHQQNSVNVFIQTGVIVLLAAALGLLTNEIRTDRLPLTADLSVEARINTDPEESFYISIDEAQGAFFSHKAVFLDARSPEIYKEGHIKGARNLPYEKVEEYFDPVMSDIPQDALIIAYCDGEHCSQSRDLALELFSSGYIKVRVLKNGWSFWVEKRLPIETALR